MAPRNVPAGSVRSADALRSLSPSHSPHRPPCAPWHHVLQLNKHVALSISYLIIHSSCILASEFRRIDHSFELRRNLEGWIVLAPSQNKPRQFSTTLIHVRIKSTIFILGRKEYMYTTFLQKMPCSDHRILFFFIHLFFVSESHASIDS